MHPQYSRRFGAPVHIRSIFAMPILKKIRIFTYHFLTQRERLCEMTLGNCCDAVLIIHIFMIYSFHWLTLHKCSNFSRLQLSFYVSWACPCLVRPLIVRSSFNTNPIVRFFWWFWSSTPHIVRLFLHNVSYSRNQNAHFIRTCCM